MDYQNFKEQFVEDVERTLYERGIENVNITVNHVDKMNDSYDAMTVSTEGSNIAVFLHVENYYDALNEGVDYQEIVDHATADINKRINEMPSLDLDKLMDYQQVKERLSLEVVSAERNASVLETVPHKLMEDMAIVYRINLDINNSESGTVLVNDSLMKMYGISGEQLHEDAVQNASIIKPFLIKGMSQVMMEMMSPEEAELFGIGEASNELMYVATVPDKTKGAGVLAYDNFMEYAVEKLGGDFFVLPSSVHEILLVKDDGEAKYEDLKQMVEQVNETEVSPEDKLTDSVYHYDSKNRVFELGEKFEARRNREMAEEKGMKGSVLQDLKEKKASVEKPDASKSVEKSVSKSRGGEAL